MDAIGVGEMRRLEEAEFASGTTVLELMERAGKECARLIEERLGTGKRVIIFCGPGNNGGDGLVCARYLKNNVAIIMPIAPKTEAAKINLERARKAGVEIVESPGDADIVVDALLGIGTKGALRGEIKESCKLINSMNAYKVSIDVPTGMDADSGGCDEDAVKPDATICIHAPKKGELKGGAGELWIADIGLNDKSIA